MMTVGDAEDHDADVFRSHRFSPVMTVGDAEDDLSHDVGYDR